MNCLFKKRLFNLGLLEFVLATVVLSFMQISANAQNSNLGGDWAGYYPNGTKSPFVWRIVQSGASLSFEDVGAGTKTKFTGQIASGKITDSNKKNGTISADNKTISWSDGVIWRWQSNSPASPLRNFPETYKTPGELRAATTNPPKVKLTFPRFSYDNNPYIADPTNANNPWKWNGPMERTIYNPLDGGILLKYAFSLQGNADGCSAGAAREKIFFQQACFAHDTNYDAPFELAGFPGGPAMGQRIADYLFFKDMQLTNDNARGTNNFLNNFTNDAAANVFYRAVTVLGKFRGSSAGKAILEKGCVVAVYNNSSAYTIVLRVSWKSPDGTYKQEQVTKLVKETAFIPLSVGAREIKVECWMQGGSSQIITATYPYEGMIAYTVTGPACSPKSQNGLNY